MLDEQKILKQLRAEIKKMENMIVHIKQYNVKSHVVRNLLTVGISINYTLPFIFSGF